MSWESFNVKQIKCLCGKGTIEQELIYDDWNRFECKFPVIKCDNCSKKFKIESEVICPKPYHDRTIYYCVDKATNEKTYIDL